MTRPFLASVVTAMLIGSSAAAQTLQPAAAVLPSPGPVRARLAQTPQPARPARGTPRPVAPAAPRQPVVSPATPEAAAPVQLPRRPGDEVDDANTRLARQRLLRARLLADDLSHANIRFDVTISETGVPTPVTKVVTLTVANSGQGSVRTTARLPGNDMVPFGFTLQDKDGKQHTMQQNFGASAPLNVDVRNTEVIAADKGILATVAVEYQPYAADAKSQPPAVTASARTMFPNGRKVTILQSADPVSDRRVIIDVTATIER